MFRTIAMTICVLAAVGLAAWRLGHPPIEPRMQEKLAEGRAYLASCQFERAYDSFRHAAALDGADPRPQRAMARAVAGVNDFDRHRRYAKGCSVSLNGRTGAPKRAPEGRAPAQ